MQNSSIELQVTDNLNYPTEKGHVDIYVNTEGELIIRDDQGNEYKAYDERTSSLLFRKDLGKPLFPPVTDENNKLQDSNIPDSLQRTSEKGQPNGYASLNTNKKIPLDQIPDEVQRTSEKGQPNGYASLDRNRKIPESQLPDNIERISNKNLPNGYAGLTQANKIDKSLLPEDTLYLDTADLKRTINNIAYPPGSLYCNFFYKTNPAKILGIGKWVYIGENNHIVADDPDSTPKAFTLGVDTDETAYQNPSGKMFISQSSLPEHKHIVGGLAPLDGEQAKMIFGYIDKSVYSSTKAGEDFLNRLVTLTDNGEEVFGRARNHWMMPGDPGHSLSSVTKVATSSSPIIDEESSTTPIDVIPKAIKMFIWFRLPESTGSDEIDNNRSVTRAIEYAEIN